MNVKESKDYEEAVSELKVWIQICVDMCICIYCIVGNFGKGLICQIGEFAENCQIKHMIGKLWNLKFAKSFWRPTHQI